MSVETTKCSHPACACIIDKGNKYCSESCKESAKLTEIACQCGHSDCPNSV
jgi:hypothetical protein